MKLFKLISIGILVLILLGGNVNAKPTPTSKPTPFKLKFETLQHPIHIDVPHTYMIVDPTGKPTGFFENFNNNKNYLYDLHHNLVVFIVKRGNKAYLYNKDPVNGGKLLGTTPLSMFNLKPLNQKK